MTTLSKILPESYFLLSVEERLRVIASIVPGTPDADLPDWLASGAWGFAISDTCREALDLVGLVNKNLQATKNLEAAVDKIKEHGLMGGFEGGFSWSVNRGRQTINLCGRDYAFSLFKTLAQQPVPDMVFRIELDGEVMNVKPVWRPIAQFEPPAFEANKYNSPVRMMIQTGILVIEAIGRWVPSPQSKAPIWRWYEAGEHLITAPEYFQPIAKALCPSQGEVQC